MANVGQIVSTEEFLGEGNEPQPAPSYSPGKVVSTEDFLGKPLTPGTVPQIAGAVPTKSGLMSLLPTKEQIPELLATTATGLATANLPAKTAVAAMGLAGQGGEIVNQFRQAYTGENPPTTFGESLKRQGEAFARGAGGELIGRGTGKLFVPFSGAVTPELEAGRNAAESVGIKAPLGTLTQSKNIQVLERGLEFTPFGAAITKQRMNALKKFGDFTETVSKKISPNLPAEVRGNIIKNKFVDVFKNYHDTTGKMYDAVMPLIREANPEVQLNNTIAKMQDIIENRTGEFAPQGLDEIKKTLKNITENKSVNAFDTLKKMRTNLGDRLSAGFDNLGRSGLKNDLEGLYGAMTEDLNATVGKVSSQALKDFQVAGAMRKKTQDFVESELFNAIEKTEPQNVYKLIITPNAPAKVALGKEILGDKFNNVSAQWFDDIVRQSTKDGIVSPVQLRNKLERYANVIPQIAKDNPALLEQFTKVRQIASLLAKGRDVSQGSVTAFAGSGMSSLGGMLLETVAMLRRPDLAAWGAGAIGLNALGTIGIISNVGRELLTRGYPQKGRVAARIIQPVAQLGLQKISGENE